MTLIYKKKKKKELKACQSDLGARESYGADHLESHHRGPTGQAGGQTQSLCVYQS